jgi:electron transport complex protein RnfG
MFTAPRIAAYQQQVLQNAVGYVMPGTTSYETLVLEGTTFYIGKNAAGEQVAIAFVAEGNGFQSKLQMIIGMNPELTEILRLKILQQAETPGLGTKIENDPSNMENHDWFTKQFVELNLSQNPISYVKNQKPINPGEIQSITAATISTRSVVDILNVTIEKNRKIYFNAFPPAGN